MVKIFHCLFALSLGIILVSRSSFSQSPSTNKINQTTTNQTSIEISKDSLTIDETVIVDVESQADEKIEILGEDFSIVSRVISSQIIIDPSGPKKSDRNLFHLKPNSVGKQKEIHIQIGSEIHGPFFIEVLPGIASVNSNRQQGEDFAEVFIKEKKLYVNQPAEISIIAYTKHPIIDSSIERKRLSHEGLHLKPIFKKNTLDTPTTINGTTFRKKVLEKFVVYPLYAGEHIISGAEVILWLKQSHFFGLQKARKKIPLPDLTLSAIPLPREEMPENFINNYGDYDFSLKWNTVEAFVGQPVVLSVKANGVGNLETLNFPKFLQMTNALQIGQPIIENNFFFNGTTYQGTKTAQYSLLFHQPGEVQIEPLTFSSFDSKKGYITQTLSPEKVIATSTVVNQPTSSSDADELFRSLKIMGSDLNGASQKILDWRKNFFYYHVAAFLIVLLTPIFLVLSSQIKKRNFAAKRALKKLHKVRNKFFDLMQFDELDLKKNSEGKKMVMELKSILKNFLLLHYKVDFENSNKNPSAFSQKEKMHREKIAAILKHYEQLLLSENEKVFSPEKEVTEVSVLLRSTMATPI